MSMKQYAIDEMRGQAMSEEAKRERDAWMETARQESINRDYYRELVVRCGEALGPATKTQDDGGVVPDVLCAKVPELVEALVVENRNARSALEALVAGVEDAVDLAEGCLAGDDSPLGRAAAALRVKTLGERVQRARRVLGWEVEP